MIDFVFISSLEGFSRIGYVPNPENSKSGVTIASGFDLGQRNAKEISDNFINDFAEKLIPYCGLIRHEAEDKLKEISLQLTDSECEAINAYAHNEATKKLLREWKRSSDIEFSCLSDEIQTVIASVAFQYGDLSRRTPNFWRQVTSGDWRSALKNLRDFGDDYKTRRNKEADLLQSRMSEYL